MENFLTFTNMESLLGIIVLLFLCWFDFSKSSQKPGNAFAYYFVLLIFLSINIFTYLFLLEYIANIELKNFIFVYSGDNSKNEHVTPILLAIFNFGTGAVKVNIHGKEVAIYSSIRSAFATILPRDQVVEKGIQDLIEKMGEETDKLEMLIDKIKVDANRSGWDIYENEYAIIKANNRNLKKQINFLTDLTEITESSMENKEKVEKITKNTQKKIVEFSTTINTSLKNHIECIFRNNIKDQKALVAIIDLVKIVIPNVDYEPKDIFKKRHPQIFSRVLGNSILFAVILGILFGSFESEMINPNKRILYLGITLFCFNLIISRINHNKPTIAGFAKSMIHGCMAGFAGHFMWIIVTNIDTVLTSWNAFSSTYDWTKTLVGVRIGLFCAIAIHMYRYYSKHITKSINITKSIGSSYIFTSILGGLLILIQHCFIEGFDNCLLWFLLGIVLTVNSIFVSAVFEINKEGESDYSRH